MGARARASGVCLPCDSADHHIAEYGYLGRDCIYAKFRDWLGFLVLCSVLNLVPVYRDGMWDRQVHRAFV